MNEEKDTLMYFAAIVGFIITVFGLYHNVSNTKQKDTKSLEKRFSILDVQIKSLESQLEHLKGTLAENTEASKEENKEVREILIRLGNLETSVHETLADVRKQIEVLINLMN